ncbi:MAG TPA: hypothetical protein VFR10_01660, partial [bacterium]|nr:hypothetical protein [bacterium]
MRESIMRWSSVCVLATLAIAPPFVAAADPPDSRPDADAKRERAAALSSGHHEVPRDPYIPSSRDEH